MKTIRPFPALFLALALLGAAQAAPAATISTFTPQGEIVQVRQVRATFSEPAIRFGDPQAPQPFDIQCAEAGSARWADERNWIYDFVRDVPPGTRCMFSLQSGFRTVAGNAVSGKTRFQFQTGGPAVVSIRPYVSEAIDEEQIFLLIKNGAATDASIKNHVYCQAKGIHERIPVRLITGKVRDELVAHFSRQQLAPELITAVQCQQRLPNEAAVSLVWDKDVATPSGMLTRQPQIFKFKVRSAFKASFSCERENANAACAPVLPVRLAFSAPVSRKLAEAIVLTGAQGKRTPHFDKSDTAAMVEEVKFLPPFVEKSAFTIELPKNFIDDTGRPLANATLFPLQAKMADYPPLAKFAAAPFGIIELNADATLPVTLRNVEADLPVRSVDGRAAPGTVASLKLDQDAGIIAWLAKLQRHHERTIEINGKDVQTRSIGLLAGEPGVKKLKLPQMADAKGRVRPFEVIGVPLKDPGYYVVELESQRLGAALLGQPAPMYVRTSALVTNLAVHIKSGRENGVVWVTTLDGARPVADAEIRVSDCTGHELWRGKTNRSGIAFLPRLPEDSCRYGENDHGAFSGWFVSARKRDDKGRADMAFALSSWTNGIEAWRFNVPTDMAPAASVRAHTVFDRMLLRAGETVSMKHVLRSETMRGFSRLAPDRLPTRVRIIHQGSGQEFQFALAWGAKRAAETVFAIPPQARLGRYDVVLDRGTPKNAAGAAAANQQDNEEEHDDYRNRHVSGSFRVEEFRLPVLQGMITPPKGPLVAPQEVPLNVQLHYLNGGGAAGQSVQVTSMLRGKPAHFPAFDGFSFDARQEDDERDDQQIIADKLPVTLDRNGAGKVTVSPFPAIRAPREMLTEMTFTDPNGEIQTVSATTPVWPAAVVAGIKADDWISVKKKLKLSAVALDTNGKPQAGVPIALTAVLKQTNSHRKKMVGGFYAYENTRLATDLGKLCSGTSDQRGLVLCEVELVDAGNVEITATASDSAGRAAVATTSVWVTREGELWFDGDNQDRIDILPEKKQYQPGEIARFQVRMPFRHATALVAIEREGVLETRVVQLRGTDPTVSVPITAGHAPNVYVSVLVVRGRMREVPWYSFFNWGWQAPRDWWRDFRQYQAPGATVDLAKPAYKFGIAEIRVGAAAHQLQVTVTADQPAYPIRSIAKATVQVLRPDGKPAAGAEIALAAVDEALLELQPNTSWDLLDAMLQRRSYGIETATAQMQVVGKRHYGRKAVPAGGSGGRAPTRELFDTLLLWKPSITLDANGRARIEVPLNDALTSFRIVAVAENGDQMFGTGSVSIRATQDLQLISGLPPLVREGDRFNAMVTLRNTTARPMRVEVGARVNGLAGELAPQQIALEAGASREIGWQLAVPADAPQLAWEISAREQGGQKVQDSIRIMQKVLPAVPVTVQQASLFQLDRTASLPLAQPAGSLTGRGGVAIALAPTLGGATDGLRRFFAGYPYICLEQKMSKAIGLRDQAMWQQLVNELPAYLDADGLAHYYPPSEANARRGSDSLTAYLLAAAHEAGFSIPQQARDQMLGGLTAFVEGRITREFWSPKKDLEVRKIAALEALSRYGLAQPRMLGSIQLAPNLWPTSAVLNWLAILQRVPAIAERGRHLEETNQILRARLNYQGSRLGFSTETGDYWWWLMTGGDADANRMVLAVLEQPAWQEDLPKLMSGAIGRQLRGHWNTTTANVWGSLALEKFSRKFEAEPVAGSTRAALEQPGAAPISQSFAWPGTGTGGGKLQLPWPPAGSTPAALKLAHDGKGKPWVTVQSLAALPLTAPFSSGYRMVKTIVPVEQKIKGVHSRGDILRVTIEIDAQADMTWVVVSDPIPGGASLLGSGLGRDSAIATVGERASGNAWLAYEERSFEAFRSYYEFVPKGKFTMTYTLRLNNAGSFNLPPTRTEAMYAPEMFGALPNPPLTVK